MDRWQLAIAEGRARTSRRIDREPALTIILDRVPFLDLVTGIANGPALFMQGKLKLDGDIALGTRLPTLFKLPRLRSSRRPTTPAPTS